MSAVRFGVIARRNVRERPESPAQSLSAPVSTFPLGFCLHAIMATLGLVVKYASRAIAFGDSPPTGGLGWSCFWDEMLRCSSGTGMISQLGAKTLLVQLP